MPGGPDFAETIPKYRYGLPGWALIIIIAIVGLLFVLGLKYAWSRLDMTVTRPKLVGGQIRGTFSLHRDLNGILSKRIGGACLIGDFAGLMSKADADEKGMHAGTCTEKWECHRNFPPGSKEKPGPTKLQKWEGYCIKDDLSGQGKCWYKPWDDPNEGLLCETSGLNMTPTTPPTPTPWPLDKVHKMPKDNGFNVQGFYDRYTDGKPADWRVSGRLLGTVKGTQSDVFSDPWCIAAPGGKPC